MKTYLFSLLVLFSISTHIFAMDELFDTDQKQDIKDFSEWITEHQTAITAGAVVASGAAVSLYKWDKRPVIISSAIAGGYIVYKWLEDQENDEQTQRINALKEQYGMINSSIGNITDDLTQIRSNIVDIQKNIEKSVVTFETIENDFKESINEVKLADDSAKRTALLLDHSIKESKLIHNDIATLIDKQKELSSLISKSHTTINDTDTTNTDKILKAITALPFGTALSSTVAGQ